MIRCEECEGNNCLDYTIQPGFSARTAVYFPPTYDRNGNNLNPDRNKTTTNYTCSNGHQWVSTN